MRNELIIKIPTTLFEDVNNESIKMHTQPIDMDTAIREFTAILRNTLYYHWQVNNIFIDIDDYYQVIKINNSKIENDIIEIIEFILYHLPDTLVLGIDHYQHFVDIYTRTDLNYI